MTVNPFFAVIDSLLAAGSILLSPLDLIGGFWPSVLEGVKNLQTTYSG